MSLQAAFTLKLLDCRIPATRTGKRSLKTGVQKHPVRATELISHHLSSQILVRWERIADWWILYVAFR